MTSHVQFRSHGLVDDYDANLNAATFELHFEIQLFLVLGEKFLEDKDKNQLCLAMNTQSSVLCKKLNFQF
jgi:hypothetical protein